MAKIIPFRSDRPEPQVYGVCLLAQFWVADGVRKIVAFYAEVSSNKELGTVSLPTEETLLTWLQETLGIEFRTAQEAVIRLIAGEVVLLHDLFTREQLMTAGFTFYPLL